MRRVIRFLVRLYPARWRRRYGTEFDTLLEDVNLGWRDLWDVLRGALAMQIATWSFGKIAAAFGVAGALVAGAVSFTMPDKYISTADLHVQRKGAATHDEPRKDTVPDAERPLNRESLTGIIERQHLYESVRARKSMDAAIERMRQDITFHVIRENDFQISFTYANAAQAQRANSEIVDTLVAWYVRDRSSGRRASGQSPASVNVSPALEVLDAPSLPRRPTGPNRAGVTAFGLSGGLLFGSAVALARHRMSQKSA